MEPVVRRTEPSVKDQLYKQTFEFDFHQAIKLLETLKPGSLPLGESGDPAHEAVKLQSRVTLSVSSSDIQTIEDNKNPGLPPIMSINFLGLAGIQGPLPTSFTELVIDRIRRKDMASRDFLDIFNHRLASLWHRLRKSFRIGLNLKPSSETFTGKCFIDLAGLSEPALQGQLAVPNRTLLGYAALLWQQPRSAVGLKVVLQDYFCVPVHIVQCVEDWCQGSLEDCSRIGVSGQFQKLGQGAILGSKVWDQTARIEVKIGPLHWQQYCDFLPSKPMFQSLRDLAYFYVGLETSITFIFIVVGQEIPPTYLNGQSQLGYTSWLHSKHVFPRYPQVTIKTTMF